MRALVFDTPATRDLDTSVEISQQSVNRFTVTYGKHVRKGLSYAQAAQELGACLLHSACCAGTFDSPSGYRPREK